MLAIILENFGEVRGLLRSFVSVLKVSLLTLASSDEFCILQRRGYSLEIILHQTGYVSTIKLSLFSGAMSFKSMKYIHQPTMHSSR